ncbi:TPA: hypothetical protein DEP58_00040 [Patescibacteria group bacterium]|nr:MAG: hypothetical protein UU98_C0021G0003 [Parcubacteria group bacterium GW2011_GWD2_42_14]HCC04680.1 hypothetical protein [Patescibacteria group bacterium]
MNFGEGVQKERESQKVFVPSGEEQNESSVDKTETDEIFQKDLQALEQWRNDLLQKCEVLESLGLDCKNLRQIIDDEYTDKKIELHERVHYVDHSA